MGLNMAERQDLTPEQMEQAKSDELMERYGFLPELSGAAKGNFEKALKAQQPLEQSSFQEREQPPEPRRVSAVQEMLEANSEHIMDRYGLSNEEAQQQSGQVPEMIKGHQPAQEPRPPRDIADPVDRETFNQQWRDEQQRADRSR